MQASFRWLLSHLKDRKVWIPLAVAAIGRGLLELANDRFYGAINAWLDAHKGWIMECVKPVLLWILNHPITWPALVIGGMFIHASSLRFYRSPQPVVVGVPASPAVPPESITDGWTKPPHNVQCVGFTVFMNDDFITATLGFQNVPTGKLLGKFEMPRLRVIYYDHQTGEELADRCPIVWWSDSGDPPAEIGVREQYAEIASFFKEELKWSAHQSNEPSEDFDSWHQLNSVELPAGDIRIIARLSGARSLRIPPVEGILTLRENGDASFVRDVKV